MSLLSAIPGAAAHVAAFVGATALIGSAWESPHAICLAAAVTLFGGKFVRDCAAREAGAPRAAVTSTSRLAPATS